MLSDAIVLCLLINSLIPVMQAAAIFKQIFIINAMNISCKLAPRRMVRDINKESTLVKVMACCHQVTSQFMNQSFKICDVTRLQWVNTHDIENVLQKQLTAQATSIAQEEVLNSLWPS